MGGNLGTKKQKQSQVPIPYPLIFSQVLGTPSHTTITNPTKFLIAFICLSSVLHVSQHTWYVSGQPSRVCSLQNAGPGESIWVVELGSKYPLPTESSFWPLHKFSLTDFSGLEI